MPVKRSTRRTVAAFKRGEARQPLGAALWTDGTVIYCCGLIIAAKAGRLVVVSPISPYFPAVVRQRIAEIRAICPKALVATAAL